MQPTIRKSIEKALDALEAGGIWSPGGAVYDDLQQALVDLEDGASVDDNLTR